MKHQNVKDRLHEGEGMVRHEMKRHHSHEGSHGIYKNEVEKPHMPSEGHIGPGMGAMPGMGCMDFKGQADSIAYGQAGSGGCKSDEKKIHSQFKNYSWD